MVLEKSHNLCLVIFHLEEKRSFVLSAFVKHPADFYLPRRGKEYKELLGTNIYKKLRVRSGSRLQAKQQERA